jgi:hypothetical protein
MEMDDLYARILDRLMVTPRNVHLAKAILRWTVCAARPLLVEELKEAIKLDIHEVPYSLEKTAGSICGNLVYVDKQQRVQIAHQTVGAYLVRDGLSSEFAVVRPQAHPRLAEACLKYLCSDEMKTPRRRRGIATSGPKKRSMFADYASVQFSEHIARSSCGTVWQGVLTMPSSIQFLVPSVGLSGSVIFKTFKYYPRSLQLVGLSQTEWNYQISCIIYPKTQAYTLACSDNKFAVGLSDGSVRLYNETTCQGELNVAHGEPVRHLALANTNMHLAAAGRKKIMMWDPFTGTLLWTATAPEILLAIEFNDIDTTLMMTTRSEYMIFWRVGNGEEEDRCQFEEVFEEVPSTGKINKGLQNLPPTTGALRI